MNKNDLIQSEVFIKKDKKEIFPCLLNLIMYHILLYYLHYIFCQNSVVKIVRIRDTSNILCILNNKSKTLLIKKIIFCELCIYYEFHQCRIKMLMKKRLL